MKRQLLATMGSTLALIGAIAAVAIVGTAAVVFDRWPAAGSDAPSATAPLAIGPQPAVIAIGRDEDGTDPAAGGTTAGGLADAPGSASDEARPPGTERSSTAAPGAAGPAPAREQATPGGGIQGNGAPAAPSPADRGTPNEQVAGAVDGAGNGAGDLARGAGGAGGAAIGTVHEPSGGSAVTSTSQAAERVEQAAAVVADALRRLPALRP